MFLKLQMSVITKFLPFSLINNSTLSLDSHGIKMSQFMMSHRHKTKIAYFGAKTQNPSAVFFIYCREGRL